MREMILQSAQEAVRAAEQLLSEEALTFVEKAAHLMAATLRAGGKILVAGNGGSLADAIHFAEELTGQFRASRPALSAIALADPGHLSCVANDMGYDRVFARGIEALGRKGDLFVALSTSGNSTNLIQALLEAERQGLTTVAFLGKGGGKMKGMATLEWIVSGFRYADRIQEAHMAAIHILIEMIERVLFPEQIQEPIEKHVALSLR